MQYNPNIRIAAKRHAKARVLERLAECAAASVMYAVPVMLIGTVTMVDQSFTLEKLVFVGVLGLFAQILLIYPLDMGLESYFVHRALGEPEGLQCVVSCFASMNAYWRGIQMGLCLLVRRLLWLGIPYLLYGAYLFVRLSDLAQAGAGTMELILAGYETLPIFMLLTLPITVKLNSYQAGYLIWARDQSLSAWQATKVGSSLFHKRLFELFVFQLSFLPWALFCIMTLGVGMVFYLPYSSVAFYTLAMLTQYPNRSQEDTTAS